MRTNTENGKNTEVAQFGEFNEDIELKTFNGIMVMLICLAALLILCLLLIVGFNNIVSQGAGALNITFEIVGVILSIFVSLLFSGLKVVKPNEAKLFTLFGKYRGVIKKAGFHYVNPMLEAFKIEQISSSDEATPHNLPKKVPVQTPAGTIDTNKTSRISLKTQTLLNRTQKINDVSGNPIEISIAIIWRVSVVTKALLNVDNYTKFLSIQADMSLRNIVRSYPYDSVDDENRLSLRGSSAEISKHLEEELQEKVEIAGLEIVEARITHLAYAPEIAQVMLQRQQASAIIDARQMIVEGAVGMVDMALQKLSKENIVDLDEERKAQMVSNLLVVLCGSKEASPVINSGSLY